MREGIDRPRTAVGRAAGLLSLRVTSERKLVEELRMHLAWRWFTGLGFGQEIPHFSTFSKNRGRFHEQSCFRS
jgi:transposase